MAAKLQCEICGGKLVGKPGGLFECESCGTEYSTAWAKAKIQEIQGTVKVEGTVDVKGSVQVEGTANAQSLIKRGYFALEDEKWDDAKKNFEEALNADPENAEAYLGLVIVRMGLHNREEFAERYLVNNSTIITDKEFDRASKFSTGELKVWFTKLEEDRKAAHEAAAKRLAPLRKQFEKYQTIISTGYSHIVGLKEDGTVVAVGSTRSDACDVYEWTDIVAVSAGGSHTVGLKADGTVEAIGENDNGQCDVSDWKDIVAVSAGRNHTVGLKEDGAVVATKYTGDKKFYYGQCDVTSWTDIAAVSVGYFHTVGLKAGGTVVAVGNNTIGQCDVANWKNIVAVSAGNLHTVGLKADGTVVAVGGNDNGQCNVTSWTDIVAVFAGYYHTVGLKADGTVVATRYIKGRLLDEYHGQCDVSDWADIVAVSAGSSHTVGLKADGTAVVVGDYFHGKYDVAYWKLFRTEEEKQAEYARACALQKSGEEKDLAEAASIFSGLKGYQDSADRAAVCCTISEKMKAERKERERLDRIAELNEEKNNLQTELANLKGFFTGKRRKEIEERLAVLDAALKMFSDTKE